MANDSDRTASKTTTITVVEKSSPSHSNSGGGGGGSPEPQSNVQVKELSQAFITNGKPVKFDFPKNATSVVYISFDAKKPLARPQPLLNSSKTNQF